MKNYDNLELSRIIGSPVDPRRPYPDLVAAVCNTDTAAPEDYTYYFDVLQDTDIVYTITSNGVITAANVTPDTPVLMTFQDYASPEYYVKLTDLANAKERVLARKSITINRALNALENQVVLNAVNTAAVLRGNVHYLGSTITRFNYAHLIDMIDEIIDFSENYVLAVGTKIDIDIKLWDWNDNKYNSLKDAFNDLGVQVIRVNNTVTIDGSSTAALASTRAFLFGTQSEMPGKPCLFVRKQLNEIEKLGGVISTSGDKPERLVFVSPNPVQVTTTRYLAVGLTGYEQFALAITNPYAISRFDRS